MTVETETQDTVEPAATENIGSESQENQQQQTEGEQGEQGQQPKDPEAPKKSRAQQRIEQTTRENAELRQKLAEYEAKQNAATPSAKPKIDDFESYEDYKEAEEEWLLSEAERRFEEKQSKASQEKAKQQQEVGMREAIENFADSHEDFHDVVSQGLARNLPLPISLDELASEFDYDMNTQVRLLYEIGNNEELHEQLSSSSKLKAARIMSEIVDSWNTSNKTPAVSKAPPPVKPVSATAAANRDPSKMSTAEYIQFRNSQKK